MSRRLSTVKLCRQIDQEEALQILHMTSKQVWFCRAAIPKIRVICSCHGDCCDILKSYKAIGGDNFNQLNIADVICHYNLQYDRDDCIKCGLCKSVCPMSVVTMDEEGYSATGSPCIRCGQCATVCPSGARKLKQREGVDLTKLPDALLDDYNLKAEYRFRNNMIK